MPKYYAGIGHRTIPDSVYDQMTTIAKAMRKKLYILRSGGAKGSDTAFQLGAGADTEIYLPWNGFNGMDDKKGIHINGSSLYNFDKAKYIASMHHPAWDKCDDTDKKFHGRNVYQILGFNLDDPVDVVICFAKPTGMYTVAGGTGTAVSIARQHGVPVYNLWYEKDLIDLKRVLGVFNV